MRRLEYLGYVLTIGLAWTLASPGASAAQPAAAPATSVRVIELIDPWTGERVRSVTEDLTAGEISRVQRALASAGFDPGRATGRMNATTALALGRFQSSRGLLRCDCVSYETVLALGIRPVVVASITTPLGQGRHGSGVLVFAPTWRPGFGHRAGVIVGHSPSVFVGHAPARGAGESKRHAVPDPRAPERPSRPRPDTSTSGSGAPIRDLTPSSPGSTLPGSTP
jgi:hypothetical protein